MDTPCGDPSPLANAEGNLVVLAGGAQITVPATCQLPAGHDGPHHWANPQPWGPAAEVWP